eukprot:CAMPEP_0182871462 /NCGR_PEP_ID=MMETSP0034_2-20130328/11133_1 /TAXON_ID=156128 /ORGANISM="Nephroselmis pyriformis, Strain CCMP717" /LENGTH=570 /DNA_ID=CAMNT_0025004013 /DNA_START=78 /DNA_END=1787 /DNA_ORIENTATION=+
MSEEASSTSAGMDLTPAAPSAAGGTMSLNLMMKMKKNVSKTRHEIWEREGNKTPPPPKHAFGTVKAHKAAQRKRFTGRYDANGKEISEQPMVDPLAGIPNAHDLPDFIRSKLKNPSRLLTPREFCEKSAVDAMSRHYFVASSRALLNGLEHSPADERLGDTFKTSIAYLNANRPFFQPVGRNRRKKGLKRAMVEPPEEKSSSEDEDDSEKKRRRERAEFEDMWERLKREVGDVMKKETDDGWESLHDVMWNYWPDVKAMFQYYCALDNELPGAPAKGKKPAKGNASDMYVMGAIEFQQFCKDSKLVSADKGKKKSKDTITMQDADVIFVRANWERDDEGTFANDESNPDRDLLMFEFCNCLVRLAGSSLAVRKVFDSAGTCAERVVTMMESYCVPNANKVDIEGFRAQLESRNVKKVFRRHLVKLQTIFTYYAAAEGGGGRQSMSLTECIRMLKDTVMFNDTLVEADMVQLFVASQNDMDFDVVDMDDVELDFAEFKEYLARAATKWNPDKFLSLTIKLEQFLEALESRATLNDNDLNSNDEEEGDDVEDRAPVTFGDGADTAEEWVKSA